MHCVWFQRRARHRAAHERALRARADYVLSLEAANATLQRYYLDDIADIILVHDTFHILLYGRKRYYFHSTYYSIQFNNCATFVALFNIVA